MYFERFYNSELAQASYLVGCQATGEAVVIDPERAVDQYLEAAEREKMSIVAVTETHIHADFLSGTRELAHRTGATMYLSDEGDADWKYQFHGPKDVLVKDGDVIEVGNLALKVLHTPGHTPEHISFVLTDKPASPEPMGVFTGDFIFVGDVGRPDLLERAAGFQDTMRRGASVLWSSLQRFREFPDYLQLWPAHGAGSACGKALGAVPQTTLGYEKLANWAFQVSSEAEFIEEVLRDQPEPPRYFAQMKRMNKVGPALLEDLPEPHVLDADELAVRLESGRWIIDPRPWEEYAREHIPGTLHLPEGRLFTTWAGWLLPYDQNLVLLAADATQAGRLRRSLQSIGLDRVTGVVLPQVVESYRGQFVSTPKVAVEELAGLSGAAIVDVRGQREWDAGHLESATHLHLGGLAARLDELPQGDPLVVHCQSGARSAIAVSLLEKLGIQAVNLRGGYAALAAGRERVGVG